MDKRLILNFPEIIFNPMEKIKKTVGKRIPSSGGLLAAEGFLKLVIALRGNKPFIPRGVYRFRSFEEKEEWAKKNLNR